MDYYNRPKLAYDYIKRVQTDVYAICQEPEAGCHTLVIVNDTLTEAAGMLRCATRTTARSCCKSDYFAAQWSRGRRRDSASRPARLLADRMDGGRPTLSEPLSGRPATFELDDYKRWLKQMEHRSAGSFLTPVPRTGLSRKNPGSRLMAADRSAEGNDIRHAIGSDNVRMRPSRHKAHLSRGGHPHEWH